MDIKGDIRVEWFFESMYFFLVRIKFLLFFRKTIVGRRDVGLSGI